MKKLMIVLFLVLASLTLNANEVSDIEPMSYQGQKGFWLSSWLLSQYQKDVNIKNGIFNILGMTDDNYEKMVKHYRLNELANKVLIGVVVGGTCMWLSVVVAIIVYCLLSFTDRGITFREL